MGQQQLLLIVLGVIVVGVAVASGINIFAASSSQANRDAVVSDLINLSSIAKAHYSLPAALGGGGNSYDNFKIPSSLKETDNGTIERTQEGHRGNHIHFTATGTEIGNDGTDPIQVEIRITSTEMTFKEIN